MPVTMPRMGVCVSVLVAVLARSAATLLAMEPAGWGEPS